MAFKNLKFRGLGLGLVVAIGLSGGAQAEVLNCQLKNERMTGGWIPLVSRTEFDPEAGTATVYFQRGGKTVSLDGKVDTRDPGRFAFKFIARGLYSVTNQYLAQMVFSVVYFKKNNRVKVNAKPMGYANNFRGRGTCRLQ